VVPTAIVWAEAVDPLMLAIPDPPPPPVEGSWTTTLAAEAELAERKKNRAAKSEVFIGPCP